MVNLFPAMLSVLMGAETEANPFEISLHNLRLDFQQKSIAIGLFLFDFSSFFV